MKKTLILVMLCSLLIPNEYLLSIYENVLLKNSKDAITSSRKMQENINKKNLKNLIIN